MFKRRGALKCHQVAIKIYRVPDAVVATSCRGWLFGVRLARYVKGRAQNYEKEICLCVDGLLGAPHRTVLK